MSRGFAATLGVAAAGLMAALLGVIAVTGRWPVEAPRTRLDAAGILLLAPERVARIEFSAGDQQTLFRHTPHGGWLVYGASAGPAVAGHIATALRLLANSAPRRVFAAGEYSPAQLVEYGLDPPHFALALAETAGDDMRLGFGELTPAQNAQYVRVVGRPELYLLPRDVGEEWLLARDMAGRAGKLLPVSIGRVWAIEILSRGELYRFERDPGGLWFHHIGRHVHGLGGLVHHADPAAAALIEAELAVLDGLPFARIVSEHPDTAALSGAGLEHPATILLLYSRDIAGPVARVELGNAASAAPGRYARIEQTGALLIVPANAAQHIAQLLQLAGSPS